MSCYCGPFIDLMHIHAFGYPLDFLDVVIFSPKSHYFALVNKQNTTKFKHYDPQGLTLQGSKYPTSPKTTTN